jgi:hypothetical protein
MHVHPVRPTEIHEGRQVTLFSRAIPREANSSALAREVTTKSWELHRAATRPIGEQT